MIKSIDIIGKVKYNDGRVKKIERKIGGKQMKTITITYDTRADEDRTKIIGETCMDITVMEKVADNLICTGQSGIAIAEIEKILKSVERLKGRIYLRGSIKDIREA